MRFPTCRAGCTEDVSIKKLVSLHCMEPCRYFGLCFGLIHLSAHISLSLQPCTYVKESHNMYIKISMYRKLAKHASMFI